MTDQGTDFNHRRLPPGIMSSSSPKYTNWSGKPPPPRGSIACVSPMMREEVVSETEPEHHIYMETPRTPNTQTLIKTQNESHRVLSNATLRREHTSDCSHQLPTLTDHQRYVHSVTTDPMLIVDPCLHRNSEGVGQKKEYLVMSEETTNTYELLPICDLMFGAVSLIAYFADIIFDFIIIHKMSDTSWFLPMLFLVIISSICSQFFSFRWYIEYENTTSPARIDSNWSSPEIIGVLITHFFQSGIFWRYFRLFVPVNLMTVKHEVGNLCMLRMIHAFLQSAPMALIQVSGLQVQYHFYLIPSFCKDCRSNFIDQRLDLYSMLSPFELSFRYSPLLFTLYRYTSFGKRMIHRK